MMGKDFKQSFEQFEALKRAENEVYAARERLRKVEKSK